MRLALAAAPAALLLACQAPEAEEEQVHRLLVETRYQEALDIAAARYRAEPDDVQVAKDYRDAAVAVLLDGARNANFDDAYGSAFEFLLQAEALDPTNPHVQAWMEKTRDSLAGEALVEAREAEAAGDLELAYERYLEADVLVPGTVTARVGAARVLLRRNHREGLGDTYYRDGVRALRDLRSAEAFRSSSASANYGDPRAAEVRREAALALAQERLTIARDLEQQDLFRAARNEYQFALLFAPELGEALEGETRMAVEAGVLELLDEVDRAVLSKDWDTAFVRLATAEERTELQQDEIARKRGEVEGQRHEWLYRRARDLEREYQFEEAIAAYDQLLGEVEYYDDAITRRETLQSYVDQADALYDRAATEQDLEERAALLRQIELLWPTYRDVRRQLRELESD